MKQAQSEAQQTKSVMKSSPSEHSTRHGRVARWCSVLISRRFPRTARTEVVLFGSIIASVGPPVDDEEHVDMLREMYMYSDCSCYTYIPI